MKFLMRCRVCGYQDVGSDDRGLMNRIKLWNHIEKVHPERIEQFKQEIRGQIMDGPVEVSALQKA